MGSDNIEINLVALTANVVLPDEFVAEKMAFVKPYANKLPPYEAEVLLRNAIVSLRLVKLIKNIPSDAPKEKQFIKELLLLIDICDNEFTNTQLIAMEGATPEEKREAYKKRERALFDTDADEWWKHRVREKYDLFAFVENAGKAAASQRSASGCLPALLLFVPMLSLAVLISLRLCCE